jgi:hypothetical protein
MLEMGSVKTQVPNERRVGERVRKMLKKTV